MVLNNFCHAYSTKCMGCCMKYSYVLEDYPIINCHTQTFRFFNTSTRPYKNFLIATGCRRVLLSYLLFILTFRYMQKDNNTRNGTVALIVIVLVSTIPVLAFAQQQTSFVANQTYLAKM